MSTQNSTFPLPADRDPNMRRLELLISRILQAGVISSVTLVVVGMIVSFVQHPDYLSSSAVLDSAVGPGATFPHEFDALLSSLRQLRGEAIVTLGLLVLIATPMMRVAVSVMAFIRHRDRTYALITAAVLCLLLLSLVLGRVE
jgi:uncharacterized membrane protein